MQGLGVEEVIIQVEALLEQQLSGERLNDLQRAVFEGCWRGDAYRDIAERLGYDTDYIKQVGSKLWQLLSQATQERVTKSNFQSVLSRHKRQHSLEGAAALLSPAVQDWGESPDISFFWGRSPELTQLRSWIAQPTACRLVALLGIGGIGKTALSLKAATEVEPDFEYIIWRSLRDAPALDELLTSVLQFLSTLEKLPEGSTAKISRLIEILRQRRCLILLDNFDTLLEAGQPNGIYRQGYEDYGDLLTRVGEVAHQSCLLITSREKPQEVGALEGVTLPVRSLSLGGLDLEAGQTLLAAKGLAGNSPETAQLIEYYRGNPLALKIAATSIQDLFSGNIVQFLSQNSVIFGGVGSLLGKQWQRLSPLEKDVMYWLAINREPVTLAELQADLLPQPSQTELLETLKSLWGRSLIESNTAGFTQQPVVMEYLTEELLNLLTQEILSEKPQGFFRYALIKAQAKDYIRDSQVRVILQPLIHRLIQDFGSPKQLEHQLGRLLVHLRTEKPGQATYGAGNLLNLFRQLESDLTDYDFSELQILQANLQDIALHRVNFSGATFTRCTFAATFGGVTSLDFSPEGESLATSDTNGKIQIWSTTSGKQLMTCQGHSSWIWCVRFCLHPVTQDLLLISCGQDHTVRVWNPLTGQCLQVLQGHTSIVTAIALSPDKQTIASASEDQSIRLWDLVSGECQRVLMGTEACVWGVAFHPDGRRLLSGGEDSMLRVWDRETGACLDTWSGHTGWVKAIALSPDGRSLVSGSFDHTLKIWDLSSGTCTRTLQGHRGTVAGVDWGQEGIASSSYDQSVYLWDPLTGECLRSFDRHTNRVWSVVFHPQGGLLASGGDDHTARLWDLQTGQCTKTFQGHSNAIYALALSPDHRLLASGHEDQAIRLWDFEGEAFAQGAALPHPVRILRGHTNRVFSLAFSPDGNFLASGSLDRTLKVWHTHTGRCLLTLQGHESWVWAIALSPDGRTLASGSYDHTVRLWDIHTGKELAILRGHTSSVLAVAFSPDGRTLASSGYEQTIKIWDVASGQCLRTLQAHENRVWAIAFHPEGHTLATAGDDRTIQLWDWHQGQRLQTLTGHQGPPLSLLFLSDKQQLISGSADGTVRRWDLATGECCQVLQKHTSWVWDLAIAPQHPVLISAGQDERLQIWNLETGEALQTLRAQRPYEGMKIFQAQGLTEAQWQTLTALGAIG